MLRLNAFVAAAGSLFAVSAATTIFWSASMPVLCSPQGTGGWSPSMAWARMPWQSWPEAAFGFLLMWIAMMAAMMLPSLAPALWRHAQAHPDRRVVLAGAGYFAVWAMVGLVAFPLGALLIEVADRLTMSASTVSALSGVVVLAAGALQFTAWKTHHLSCCRQPAMNTDSAWRDGMRLGLHCCCSCAGPMVVLLVLGTMDLRVMVAVTVAISAERLARCQRYVVRAVGFTAIGVGLFLVLRVAMSG